MSLTREDISAMGVEIGTRLRRVLQDVAVPQPSRNSEYYAALTLAIVLLKEKAAEAQRMERGETRNNNLNVIMDELDGLHKKRAELEEELAGEEPGEILTSVSLREKLRAGVQTGGT